MKQVHALAPGTRVRNGEGSIGTVERLVSRTTKGGQQPSQIMVRSDDGHRRYRIPITLVTQVTHSDQQDIAMVTLPTAALSRYLLDATTTEQAAIPTSAVGADAFAADTTTVCIPLAAEEVVVTTRPIQRGTLHLHMSVATEEQSFTVPTLQERVIIEHIPAAQFDAAVTDSHDVIIPVTEERLVIRKEQVVTEYIRIHTETVTQQHEVRETVRREILTIQPEPLTDSPTPLVHLVADRPRS